MTRPKRTALYDQHVALGARMVEFAGWEMPLQYPLGTVQEHLATRSKAGLFDISHMGRFVVRGRRSLEFLQHVLTNNAEALDGRPTAAQYTVIQNEAGGAIDDAYLYRFLEGEYLLVVNAANREKDWQHLRHHLADFNEVELVDYTEDVAMLALQGPLSRDVLAGVIESGRLPEPVRNAVSIVRIGGFPVKIGRTGYTGEPLCFELFVDRDAGPMLWGLLLGRGATPVGLGARDTLRLEAGLPLYGHELGQDPDGNEIPVLAVPLTKSALSFSPINGDFVGREALRRQFEALTRIMARNYSAMQDLPRRIRPVAVTDRGVARGGARVHKDGRHVGYVTSGTIVPFWIFEQEGGISRPTDRHDMRAICLAYIDSDIRDDDAVTVDVRGRSLDAVVVPYHLRSEAPPYARPIIARRQPAAMAVPISAPEAKVRSLLVAAATNTAWRQQECINLIPSEMTTSPMVRLLSVMDPAFRYGEHRQLKAFYDADVFYYQGTEFISEVERLLEQEMRLFLGCYDVETRVISGQMANAAVFSAMVDYINRTDRRQEPRRIRRVLNHHIGKGGHLSAQPMGALRDFVARDPRTERPAVVNFPVLAENPYQIDVPATLELIDTYRPELIVFGKSMTLHKEPVAEIRRYLDDQLIQTVVMYDMAHVLGLVGPHFQQPFAEGADLVTGSTHKTYFGTQRGVVGGRYQPHEDGYDLWQRIRGRAFPGSLSNHHLGTLLGLLMAAYEMNHFKEQYQPRVIANAKAFARALHECGLIVAGDPAIDFTETHQVIVHVGYAHGPAIARRLEENNVICNYQAVPGEEGFTAAGGLRLGVAEMTRFGMGSEDFRHVAEMMRDIIVDNADVAADVSALRRRFGELQFCFKGDDYAELMTKLHALL